MNATPGPILPKICDWMLNKNYESHTRSQTTCIGNRFQFPSFRYRVKAITRESRTLPAWETCVSAIYLDLDLGLESRFRSSIGLIL